MLSGRTVKINQGPGDFARVRDGGRGRRKDG